MPTPNRIALVGMSTTGKTSLGQACKLDTTGPLVGYEVVDSDAWIAEQILGDSKKPGIARIFFDNGRTNALGLIAKEEEKFLAKFTTEPVKVIFALGPNIGCRANWKSFAESVILVRLEKTANQVYKGLLHRRNELKEELETALDGKYNNHRDFGCWDIDVMVDSSLRPLAHNDAQRAIQTSINRVISYYPTKNVLTCPQHPDKLNPQDLYGLIL